MSEPSQAIMQHVPSLRRHARLLTGSHDIGDEYVRICLELVLEEPERIAGDDLRVALFRAFHDVWDAVAKSIEGASAHESTQLEERLEQGLARLAPLERRALLLVVAEGFTYEQVAAILGIDQAKVRSLIDEARHALYHDVSVPVLIIEDQSLIAMDVSRIVEEMGHHVIGVVAREQAAVQEAREQHPGLVLADVRLLDDESGIAAAQKILESYDVPVVFVTGYPERLLTGGGVEPAFVVSKPFDDEALKVTIGHALATYASPEKAGAHRRALLAKLAQITGTGLDRFV
jgi:RNA polymerase sigma factor (sigma-70 family)